MFSRNILISLALHGLFFLPIFVSTVAPELNSEPIEIEMKVVATLPAKKPTGVTSVTKSSGLLFPEMSAQTLLAKVERNNALISATRDFNDPQTYQEDISEVFGENGNQNWAYHREIYRRIDANLTFDSILAQYNHFGRIYVQFKIDENGQFDLANLRTDADDPILKVHVLRAIRNSLTRPLENLDRTRLFEVKFFQAEFNFRYGNHNENFQKQTKFGRPVFVFNRTTGEKPVPKELLDQLLSGGVTPNVSLMYERWQKYNKKKHLEAIQFDPFENYKRDAFYQL